MSTFITIVGFVLMLLAGVLFAFKLYIAVESARCLVGAGGVPTFDGALFPPLALILGLWIVRLAQPDWPRPNLLLVWIGATVLGFMLHFAIARYFGKQPSRPDK